MVLLTSSQVSVAITSFIIFIFTTALFLSGYVLQQQTVRDIRAVIKPQLVATPPEMKMFLPEKFRNQDGEEGRGVVDVQESYGDEEGSKRDNMEAAAGGQKERDSMIGATRWQKEAARKKKEQLRVENEESQTPMGGDKQNPEQAKVEEKPLSRAERRKKIKEEILLAGEGEGFKGYRRRMW